jgi:hypothetical protein
MSGSVPARIAPPERALPPLRLLRTVVDNPIKAWPRAIYRERIVRSRVLGRDTVYVMAPDLIRQMLTDETDNFEKGEIARRGLGACSALNSFFVEGGAMNFIDHRTITGRS